MKVKSNRGGKRPGAGRKAGEDRKIPVTFYVLQSVINSYGNIDNYRGNFAAMLNELKK